MFLAHQFENEMVVSDVRNICDIENQYHGQNLSKGNIWPHPVFFCHIPYSIKMEICDHVNFSLKRSCKEYMPRGEIISQTPNDFFCIKHVFVSVFSHRGMYLRMLMVLVAVFVRLG